MGVVDRSGVVGERCEPAFLWGDVRGLVSFQAEGGEGGAVGLGVGVLAGEVVEDGGGAPGGEGVAGDADAVGVGGAVLGVDASRDGGVEDEAVVFVGAGSSFGVVADVGVERGEEAVVGAFAVAGGEDDGVGGEA
ncbi:hypothetical protein [Streptomyces sp. CC210A]|uniref:hypothetical protein n=1 Tax=Streptomyces sp. CC210A TaxID=2898184 RepID=UPI0035A8C3FD